MSNEFDPNQDQSYEKEEVVSESTGEIELEFEVPVQEPVKEEVTEPVDDDIKHIVSSKGTPNAQLTSEYETESDKKEKKEDDIFLPMPSYPLDELNIRIREVESIAENMKEVLKEWREVLSGALEVYTPNGLRQDRFTDPTSQFNQGIEVAEGKLNTISSLKLRSSGGGEMKGEMALLKVSKFLGLGEVFSVPLPHSGFWVNIKPPAERDIIDFMNMVYREKQILGRETQGYTLTNMSVHINNRIFDFILKHIHSHNYKDIPKEELRNKILIHDLPILIWGLACSIYPNGFEYERACIDDLEECSYIHKAKLSLDKLLWVDNGSLSSPQRQIMSESRPNSLTTDNYNKFIAEHTRVVSSTFVSKKGISFKLRVPTIADYITDGLKWVNSVTNQVESALIGQESDDEVKMTMLNQHLSASMLRQYNHFIEHIEVDGDIIVDRNTIDDALGIFSADDEIREELIKAVIDFKAKTCIGIIGIPEYICPSCKKEQKAEEVSSKVTNVIPLDVTVLFFLMLSSKMGAILSRLQ